MIRVPFRRLAVSIAFAAALLPRLHAQAAGYDQLYRPQIHFSPRTNWTNDPNGLVYFHGEYHLFFQYNPFGDEWGHMSWGHAVSTDLLHWKQLPVAIPEEDGIAAFTGSVVIDKKNTSGFCASGQPCLVAIYTGSGNTPEGPRQRQNLAYSRDRGRTWTIYAGNPVLDLHLTDFRDPSVAWDDKEQRWLMVVSLPLEHRVQFYSSPNLKDWTHLSDFGPAGDTQGAWECPDLVRLSNALHGKGVWALKIGLNPGAPNGGSGEQYFLGDFNGRSFTALTSRGAYGWTNYGTDDYCAISYNGLPQNQNPVLIGWMNNWQYAAQLPTAPWRGQMSLPRRLTLIDDQTGMALSQTPVVARLRRKELRFTSDALIRGIKLTVPYELDLDFDSSPAHSSAIRLYSDDKHWTEIGFDADRKTFYVDRTHSGREISPQFPVRTDAPLAGAKPHDVRIIVDRSSVEAFAQNGTIAMTQLIFPPETKHNNVRLQGSWAALPLLSAKAWELRSIWDPRN